MLLGHQLFFRGVAGHGTASDWTSGQCPGLSQCLGLDVDTSPQNLTAGIYPQYLWSYHVSPS